MIFIFLLIIALFFVSFPKAVQIFFIAPIIGFLSGSVFWGVTAIITESVKSFEAYAMFLIVTTVLYIITVFVED
jgi:hypothetical protein